jgi:hypothetical protein
MTQYSENDITYQREPSILGSELNSEYVLLEQKEGVYFGVQGVGYDIWQLLEKPTTRIEIMSTLLARYDIDINILSRDTHQFLDQLLSDQLVSIKDA